MWVLDDPTTVVLLGGIFLILSFGLWVCCMLRYQVAVFLVMLSPWFSALHFPGGERQLFMREAVLGSYLRLGLLLFIGAVGVTRYLLCRERGKLPLQMKLLGVFIGLAILSALYSVDPFYTLVRVLSLMGFFGFLLGLEAWMSRGDRLQSTLNSVFWLICVGVIANALSLFVLGGRVWLTTGAHRFLGLWGHPNSMGSFCMLAYPILLWKANESSKLPRACLLGVAGIAVVLHLLTGSRATILAAVVGLTFWFRGVRQTRRVVLLWCLAGLTGLLLFLWPDLRGAFERETDAGRSVVTLTGREQFWSASLTLITENPILGYGYGVAGAVLQDPRFQREGVRLWSGSARASLHNGYLSMAIDLGLPVSILWATLIYIALKGALACPDGPNKALLVSIMLMCLLLNFAESAIGTTNFTGVLFWTVWFLSTKISGPGPGQQDGTSLKRREF